MSLIEICSSSFRYFMRKFGFGIRRNSNNVDNLVEIEPGNSTSLTDEHSQYLLDESLARPDRVSSPGNISPGRISGDLILTPGQYISPWGQLYTQEDSITLRSGQGSRQGSDRWDVVDQVEFPTTVDEEIRQAGYLGDFWGIPITTTDPGYTTYTYSGTDVFVDGYIPMGTAVSFDHQSHAGFYYADTPALNIELDLGLDVERTINNELKSLNG